jgi:hypothetical protein
LSTELVISKCTRIGIEYAMRTILSAKKTAEIATMGNPQKNHFRSRYDTEWAQTFRKFVFQHVFKKCGNFIAAIPGKG